LRLKVKVDGSKRSATQRVDLRSPDCRWALSRARDLEGQRVFASIFWAGRDSKRPRLRSGELRDRSQV